MTLRDWILFAQRWVWPDGPAGGMRHSARRGSPERFGPGAVFQGLQRSGRDASRAGDLAFGAGPHASVDVKVEALGPRWIEPLLERYNASSPEVSANGRRRNGLEPSLLTPEVLDAVRLRLACPPPRRWAVVEPQGGRRDGVPPRAGARFAPARLGGAEGTRLVAEAPATQEPEVRYGRRVGGVQN